MTVQVGLGLPLGLQGEVAAHNGSRWSHRIDRGLNVQDYGVTDLTGATTYTTEVQACFDDAYTAQLPVIFPSGTIKTGTINWKGQSFIGTGSGLCILKGLPSQDILHLDPTITHYAHPFGCAQGVKFLVDDSVDASASFAQRGGKGNAGIAADFANGAAAYPMILMGWVVDDLVFEGSGTVIGGQNKVCGIYSQHALFNLCQVGTMTFNYLANGWWDHFPTSNLASNSNARDHIRVGTVWFSNCGNSWRLVNWSYARVDHLVMHATQGTALDFTASTDLSIGLVNDITFGTAMIEDTQGQVFSCTGIVQTIRMEALVTNACANAPTWAGIDSQLNNWTLVVDGNPSALLTISGNHNTVNLRVRGDDTSTYAKGTVVETGYGNDAFAVAYTSTGALTQRRRIMLSRDGRVGHLRDATSVLLGHTTKLFRGGDDLLVNPRYMIPSGSTEGVGHEYEADTATEFGVALKILGATGNFFVSDDALNGVNAFRVGDFLPPTWVRVYVRAKATTGGTQGWSLRDSASNVLGSATHTLTTSYATYAFDADVSTEVTDEVLILNAGVMGGGGAAPIWVEWVAFRPFHMDLPWNAAPTYTVTNPTTDRALNVTGDTLAQGLQVLGTLIADRKLAGILK